ncbi:MAG: hypothetical protein AVDCRST_MAG17-587 [uncultured Solirubrobacterales bacterium]|uniref:Uncharacterized protein n=1 Tax=uncultured Solirubrobacterales bacterium TaxID=768556 RepID=A0A6J4S7V9_9ACTN|nr:MAG: hypothetical protein AVDCRST_MAG17-587 [uncultured Solirubrobacterales bacterium]
MLPLLAVVTRVLAALTLDRHYVGRCPACHRPVSSADDATWSRDAVHHQNCTRCRMGDRGKGGLPWPR